MGIRHGIDPNDPGADYENAIREGSTSVRVGSSIFGARHYPKWSLISVTNQPLGVVHRKEPVKPRRI